MKAIILAAGEGSRLRPYTADRPKCLVEVDGESLLQRQLEVLRAEGVEDVLLIGGYRAEALARLGLRLRLNPDFASTNMVWTLFSARDELAGDLLISYGDIVYPRDALRAVLDSKADVAVAIDRRWESYWRERNENPLADAETLKVGADGRIVEIGQKPKSLDEIQGQYIGLVRYSRRGLAALIAEFDSAAAKGQLRGKDPRKAYMTDLLQALIDSGQDVRPAFFDGGWVEVDTASDLEMPGTASRLRAIREQARARGDAAPAEREAR